jgi:pSer/pThr/pTyr-binding forkhead associated (FHA) protein
MSAAVQEVFSVVGTREGTPGGTHLESAAEIRRATAAGRVPTAREDAAEPETPAFRPRRRAPTALLCILDDGLEDGEWVRLRSDRVVIGRAEGDVLIPHDAMISGRHAELVRTADDGQYRWHLADLQSTNGTYVRITRTVLRHGQEFLVGAQRYRFEAAPEAAPAALPAKTSGWEGVGAPDRVPCLVELRPQGDGERFPLTRAENWIGRDAAQCGVVPAGDLLVSPRHARICRGPSGRWRLENAGSRNGTWLRITKLPLSGTCQFQVGEQRFLVRLA